MQKKKKPKYNKDSAIRSALRRTFSRSPIVQEVMKTVRRERPWYKKDGTLASKPRVEFKCSVCNSWHMGKNIQVDHRDPVVDPHIGFIDWNTFIERLFCEAHNLDLICKDCHKIKTDHEKSIAVIRRKNLKNTNASV